MAEIQVEDESWGEETYRPRISEREILTELQTDLQELDGDNAVTQAINTRLFETQKQYYTVYMDKLLKKIPMGDKVAEIVRGKENNFEYMFTAAKSIIQSQMNVTKIKALHAVFDMVYSVGFRFVHERIVTPALQDMLTFEQCQKAYKQYSKTQKEEREGESSAMLEMQSLLYCIQETLNNHESVKIRNPLYNRMMEQFKGLSEYIYELLLGVSKQTSFNPFGREDDLDLNVNLNLNAAPNETKEQPGFESKEQPGFESKEQPDFELLPGISKSDEREREKHVHYLEEEVEPQRKRVKVEKEDGETEEGEPRKRIKVAKEKKEKKMSVEM